MCCEGDFGLCVSRFGEDHDEDTAHAPEELGKHPTPRFSTDLTRIRQGTTLYMAPEAGKKITEKCDIFALGICLFELTHFHSTAMERVRMLSALRESGELPGDVVELPQAALILRMVSHDPECRPQAGDLVGGGGNEGGEVVEGGKGVLRDEVEMLKLALQDRNAMVSKQALKIAALQAMLAQLQDEAQTVTM